METLAYILLALVGLLLILILFLGFLYAAIVVMNNHKWEKLKSKKYNQHNMVKDETKENIPVQGGH